VQADASAGMMRFSITDTGIGIAPEHQKKLFKPFIQVDSSLSRQYEGTGLGLSLVKKLVEMHGGSIELKSEVGKGSCFAFTLPWQPTVDVAEKQHLVNAQDNSHQTAADSLSTPRGKILIVDDNESNIMMVQDYLANRSYQIRTAFNGSEAIKQAIEFLPDLILMDVQMPHMNGFEATKRLRTDPQFATVPIIALTAFAMPGDRERCIEAGMDQYLSKPVKLKELQQMIESFLDHSASE
jgi:CheY-like chemotaxis protein